MAGAGAPPPVSSVFSPNDIQKLYESALGDFRHDFNDPGRSDVTQHILNSVPIEYSKTPNKNYAGLAGIIATAKAAAGSAVTVPAQAYWVFKNSFELTVPSAPIGVKGELHEEDVLALAGIPYTEIMSTLQRPTATTPAGTILPFDPVGPMGFENKHNYRVASCAAKYAGTYGSLPNIMSALANGATTFVLMWDAGNISVTRLAENAEGGPFTFFFVRSKENISDPAGKISPDSVRSSENVHVYFLEDELEHVSSYPIYTDGSTNNQNLFSNFTLTTHLKNETSVSGTINVGNVTLKVDDIGKQSEVRETVIRAIHMRLNGEPEDQIMPYFFLKRAGDWCQALCLLDRARTYRVKPAPSPDGSNPPPIGATTTIANIENAGGMVAMITVDRIMLAYLIATGQNVFYTNARNGGTWITLFQNTDEGKTDDVDVLMEKLGTLPGIVDTINTRRNKILGDITAMLAADPLTNIAVLRKLYLLAKSIPTAASLQDLVAKADAAAGAVTTIAITPTTVAVLRNTITKLESIVTALPPEDIIPASSTKDAKAEEAIANLFELRDANLPISRSDAGIAAVREFIDDIKSTLVGDIPIPGQIRYTARDDEFRFPATRSGPAETPTQVLVNYWNTAFQPARVGGGRNMKGGAVRTLSDLYTVYPYNPADQKGIAVAALMRLKGNNTAAIGSSVMLPNGFLATVVDEYLIDDESEDVLNALPDDDYKQLRIEVLELDKIRMKIHMLDSADALDASAQETLARIRLALEARVPISRPTPIHEIPPFRAYVDEFIAATYPDIDAYDDVPERYSIAANAAFLRLLRSFEVDVNEAIRDRLGHFPSIVPSDTDVAAAITGGITDDHVAYEQTNENVVAADDSYEIVAGINKTEEKVSSDAASAIASLRATRPPPVDNPFAGPVEWQRFIDPASGAPFYFNSYTGESQWALPMGGGLRERRSLYTKHVGGSAPAPRRGLYAGLRQRSGPRTTARVRQHTGNSKTRRQRKHLDRI